MNNEEYNYSVQLSSNDIIGDVELYPDHTLYCDLGALVNAGGSEPLPAAEDVPF